MGNVGVECYLKGWSVEAMAGGGKGCGGLERWRFGWDGVWVEVLGFIN